MTPKQLKNRQSVREYLLFCGYLLLVYDFCCNFVAKWYLLCANRKILCQRLNNMKKDIDELDRKILCIITRDAHIPIKDIAEQCGVSRAAIHQRIQRMYNIGVIIGSGYYVDHKMLGYQLCAYIGITLEKGNQYKAVSAELEKIPEVVESQFTLGAYSLLVKLYARNDEHLMELLNDHIQEIPGVAKTETLTALDQRIKRSLPIRLEAEE